MFPVQAEQLVFLNPLALEDWRLKGVPPAGGCLPDAVLRQWRVEVRRGQGDRRLKPGTCLGYTQALIHPFVRVTPLTLLLKGGLDRTPPGPIVLLTRSRPVSGSMRSWDEKRRDDPEY
jgi:hypothetical protein